VALAILAMGGHAALQSINNEQLDSIDHTLLTEQSYRQAPFIASYDRTVTTIDFQNGRVRLEAKSIWPEADPDPASAESDTTIVSSDTAAVLKTDKGDTAAGLVQIDDARTALTLGPERLLLTAQSATDLHFEPAETLRSTPHSVVAFKWYGRPMKVLINSFNHLPDATECVRTFDDFWFVWGDVKQRIYFDNWKLIGAIVYPTNRIEERNGILWNSSQVLGAKMNIPLDDSLFEVDKTAALASGQSKGWNRPFKQTSHVELAPGVDLFQGSWNITLIRQEDGLLVLEAPISASFTAAVLAKARADHPTLPIKAVLSTSDSWPHVAGVREAVAQAVPIYILDLNQPLLDNLVSAPHTQTPDTLQTSPRKAIWHIVSSKTVIGTGANRVELYPLRGAATERQYMVYFPQHKLLYASDTLALDSDTHKLYDPQLVHEVIQAAEREHLDVETVYAMHNGPAPWSEVRRLVAAETSKVG
jgi:hypothetical protein